MPNSYDSDWKAKATVGRKHAARDASGSAIAWLPSNFATHFLHHGRDAPAKHRPSDTPSPSSSRPSRQLVCFFLSLFFCFALFFRAFFQRFFLGLPMCAVGFFKFALAAFNELIRFQCAPAKKFELLYSRLGVKETSFICNLVFLQFNLYFLGFNFESSSDWV